MKELTLGLLMLSTQLYSAETPAFDPLEFKRIMSSGTTEEKKRITAIVDPEFLQTMKDEADGGDMNACMAYGGYLIISVPDKENDTTQGRETIALGVSYLTKAADLGHGGLCYILGMAYSDGELGLSPDTVKAMSYLQKAVDKNVVKAYVMLAGHYVLPGFRCYFPEKVIALLEKSIAAGDLVGYSFYAVLLREASFIKQDLARAFTYFKKVSDEGDFSFADSMVAMMCQNGEGCEKSYPEAEKYYKKAIAKDPDDVQLQRNYGEFLLSGYGSEPNLVYGRDLLTKAAEAEDCGAQKLLGSRLLVGMGFDKDRARGIEYLRKAAAQGDADSVLMLRILNSYS
ncbi:MAG: sel1 repeat family protein [Candidatus Paracaedibacteraceae bacterium]|nr:sel1 repeat family protein [Candidatus Paracaedibacteraceae bacterium]